MKLLRQARPVMLEVAREYNEATYLVVRRGEEVLFLDVVDTVQKVRLVSQVGRRFSLGATAPGRVFLAFEEGVASGSAAEIRRAGFCVDSHGVCEEASCAAVPVFDVTGDVVGVLAFMLPDFRVSRESLELELLPALMAAGGMISSRLGYLLPHFTRRGGLS
jgi:DNA-binding IclR family transcriptional regulator